MIRIYCANVSLGTLHKRGLVGELPSNQRSFQSDPIALKGMTKQFKHVKLDKV
jgi:hypothetical protein